MALTRFQNTEEIFKDVDDLVAKIENLRVKYEQYFLGIDRKEPEKEREDIRNLIRKYSQTAIQNTRAKFRYQQAVARYNTYQAYWDRVLKEIEEGRYERDVFRAKLHEQERGVTGETVQKSSSGKATVKDSPQDPVEALFQRYKEARVKCNEDVSKMNLETFRKTISQQMNMIKQKTGASGIRFAIDTTGGKAKIKAMPQTSKK